MTLGSPAAVAEAYSIARGPRSRQSREPPPDFFKRETTVNSNEQEVIRLAKAYSAAGLGLVEECDAVYDLGEFALGLARELEQEERLRHQCEEALVATREQLSFCCQRDNARDDEEKALRANLFRAHDECNSWRRLCYMISGIAIFAVMSSSFVCLVFSR